MVPVEVNYGECKHCGYTGPLQHFKTRVMCMNCEESIRTTGSVRHEASHPSQQKAAIKAVEALLSSRRNEDTPSVSQLVNAMMEQFGGANEFARSWHTAIMTAKLEDPGSAKVLRAHEQLAKLVKDANQLRIQDRPATELSDEELREEMLRMVNEEIAAGRLLENQ